jgi:hypothetical protein
MVGGASSHDPFLKVKSVKTHTHERFMLKVPFTKVPQLRLERTQAKVTNKYLHNSSLSRHRNHEQCQLLNLLKYQFIINNKNKMQNIRKSISKKK